MNIFEIICKTLGMHSMEIEDIIVEDRRVIQNVCKGCDKSEILDIMILSKGKWIRYPNIKELDFEQDDMQLIGGKRFD